jgi:glyoxylase-like metal-dependent hydrolase (beta-lactamase superfamily II)
MNHLPLGSAAITLINAGDIRADLVQWLQTPASDWPQHHDVLAQPIAVPMQSTHIMLSDASVLVDAPRWSFSTTSEFFLPGYAPPPDLVTQLAEAGIRAADITHVVITHAHFDHFNGLLNSPRPLEEGLGFSNAWHYIGRPDWDGDEIQAALRKPDTLTSHTLGALDQRNVLIRVQGDLRITGDITILAAPGETPGHQIVRVHSAGQTLYCIGDLYHHEVEFEHPDWQVWWADADANRASRERFVEAALYEDALIVAAHIRGVGKLRRTTNGVRWERLTLD